jgi:hypothetical protein
LKVRLARRASRDWPVWMAHLARPEGKAQPARLVSRGRRVPRGLLDLPVQPERRASKAFPECRARTARLERRGRKDHRALRVSQGCPANGACQDLPGRMELPDKTVRRVPLDRKASPANRVRSVPPDRPDQAAMALAWPAPKVHLDRRGRLGHKDRQVRRESRVSRARKGLPEQRARKGRPVRRVLTAKLGRPALRGRLVRMARMARRERMATLANLVHRDSSGAARGAR